MLETPITSHTGPDTHVLPRGTAKVQRSGASLSASAQWPSAPAPTRRSSFARREHASAGALPLTHRAGERAILQARPALLELAARHGQLDSIQDLAYFLQKPGLMRRTPHLLLMGAQARTAQPQGALLIHEFRPFGCPTRSFAVSDRSGRGVVLGAPEDRLAMAIRATTHLVHRGAQIVLLTLEGEGSAQLAAARMPRVRGTEWAIRTRQLPSFLALCPTYEATLASLGQKTRQNLRYYRRRAEEDLHCRFVPEANVSMDDLIAFNRASTFPVPDRSLRWRMNVQRDLHSPYIMGLQDGTGRWLSLIGGRRFGTSTEILWQMNMGDLPRQSIVSAMRSYHLQHEIERGSTRLYIEGGTPHSMQNSFQTAPTTDLILVRTRIRAGIAGFARRFVPPDNALGEMLNDPATEWNLC